MVDLDCISTYIFYRLFLQLPYGIAALLVLCTSSIVGVVSRAQLCGLVVGDVFIYGCFTVLSFVASQRSISNKDRFMWGTLAMIMAGLSLDEIGSLHERLSLIGGWWMLAPFALVGISMTLYTFWRL
ncbi:MAG: hypothetical protein OER96_06590 [Gammaproteobacteria bacterium]|nr:hypothetical protein [Gammaproteobacteria bacterium]